MLKTLENGKFEVEISGKPVQFDTEAAANEAIANNANREAAMNWARAAEGGAKFRDYAFGLAILAYAVNAEIKADKVKPKDLTADAIFGYVERITDDDLDAVLAKAKQLVTDFAQLTGKHQAPMKGGKLPRDVAASAAVLVKAETGAAQKESARTAILAAI